MNLTFDPEVFRRQLVTWSIRGVLCAAPSWVWAMVIDFKRPFQLEAMFAGVASYVIAFAWATSLPTYCERVERGDFGWSLRWAANIRAGLAPMMFFGPDMFLGGASLRLVELLAHPISVAPFNDEKSFGFTYALTVTQGALVSITMFGLALIIWMVRTKCWERVFGNRGAWTLPPAA